MRIVVTVVLSALMLMISSSSLIADVAPKLMNYQALITDDQGQPLEGAHTVTFTIYGSATGSDILWQESHTTSLIAGQLNAVLGQGDVPVPIDETVFSSSEAWLGITIGGDPELTPRTRLVSVPYSQRVSTLDLATGGAISGGVQIDPPSLKSGEALETSLIVRGSAGDSVVLSPDDDIVLYATDDAGDVALKALANAQGGTVQIFANAGAAFAASSPRYVLIQPASNIAFRATGDNGDDLILMSTPPEGGTIQVNASDQLKATTRSVKIDPAQNIVIEASEENGDATVSLTSGPLGGAMQVSSSDAAKAVTRSVQISPADNIVLQATEDNGDATIALTSGPSGAAFRVSSSDALKGLTGSVVISPSENVALQAKDDVGNTLVDLSTSGGAGKLSLTTTAKATSRVEITNDGIIFWDATKSDTNMIIQANGDIKAKGRLAMGADNFDSGIFSNVLGVNNDASGDSSVVCGGFDNVASGSVSAIGGGTGNTASGFNSVVGGGQINIASASNSNVGGGRRNYARAIYSTVAGGGGLTAIDSNSAMGAHSAIGGGRGNVTKETASTVAGGHRNTADALYSTVSGGALNTAGATLSAVGGGSQNRARGEYSVVSGGGGSTASDSNSAIGNSSAIGGGSGNLAGGLHSRIGGGKGNRAWGDYSVVAGGGGANAGDSNSATGNYSIIAGGYRNVASNSWTTAIGSSNTASGIASTCLGLLNNSRGNFSGTIGRAANANHDGSWVFAASSATSSDSISSGGNEQFVLRADGGMYITNGAGVAPYNTARLINTSTGAYLTTGGTWTDASDRNLKENVSQVNAEMLLQKLRQLQVTEWNYIAEGDEVKRIGPMGQDFYKIFGYGADEKSLSARDLASIALVAVQELDRKTSEIDDLKAELARMQLLIDEILSNGETIR